VVYAERVRREAERQALAVGLITHTQQAEAILAEGRADLVAIGREALVDPNRAPHAARHLGHDATFDTWRRQAGRWLAGRQKICDFYEPGADAPRS